MSPLKDKRVRDAFTVLHNSPAFRRIFKHYRYDYIRTIMRMQYGEMCENGEIYALRNVYESLQRRGEN